MKNLLKQNKIFTSSLELHNSAKMEIFNFDYSSDETKSLEYFNQNHDYHSDGNTSVESIKNEPGNIDKRMTLINLTSWSPSAVVDADTVRSNNQIKKDSKIISIIVLITFSLTLLSLCLLAFHWIGSDNEIGRLQRGKYLFFIKKYHTLLLALNYF